MVSLCRVFFFFYERGLFNVIQDLKDTPRNLCRMLGFSPPCSDQTMLAADLRSFAWQSDKTHFREVWHDWRQDQAMSLTSAHVQLRCLQWSFTGVGFDSASKGCPGVKDSWYLFSVPISSADALCNWKDLTQKHCCPALHARRMERTVFFLCLSSSVLQGFRGKALVNEGTYLSEGLCTPYVNKNT